MHVKFMLKPIHVRVSTREYTIFPIHDVVENGQRFKWKSSSGENCALLAFSTFDLPAPTSRLFYYNFRKIGNIFRGWTGRNVFGDLWFGVPDTPLWCAPEWNLRPEGLSNWSSSKWNRFIFAIFFYILHGHVHKMVEWGRTHPRRRMTYLDIEPIRHESRMFGRT